MWDVLPILVSSAYDNFPEVDKAECCYCLKMDEINIRNLGISEIRDQGRIVSKKRHY